MYNFQTDKNAVPVFCVNAESWTEYMKETIAHCASQRPCYILVESKFNNNLTEITCPDPAVFEENIPVIDALTDHKKQLSMCIDEDTIERLASDIRKTMDDKELRLLDITARVIEAKDFIDIFKESIITMRRLVAETVSYLCRMNGGMLHIEDSRAYVTHCDIYGEEMTSCVHDISASGESFTVTPVVQWGNDVSIDAEHLEIEELLGIFDAVTDEAFIDRVFKAK